MAREAAQSATAQLEASHGPGRLVDPERHDHGSRRSPRERAGGAASRTHDAGVAVVAAVSQDALLGLAATAEEVADLALDLEAPVGSGVDLEGPDVGALGPINAGDVEVGGVEGEGREGGQHREADACGQVQEGAEHG